MNKYLWTIIGLVAGTHMTAFAEDQALVDPADIAVDTKGNIYVIDSGTAIRKYDENGNFKANLGNGGNIYSGLAVDGETVFFGAGDRSIWQQKPNSAGTGYEAATIKRNNSDWQHSPAVLAIAIGPDQRIYAADSQWIVRLDSVGYPIDTRFTPTKALAVDKRGNVYFGEASHLNSRVFVARPTDSLHYEVVKILQSSNEARASAVAVDENLNVYVADGGSLRMYNSNGELQPLQADAIKQAVGVAIYGDKIYVSAKDGVWRMTPKPSGGGFDCQLIVHAKI